MRRPTLGRRPRVNWFSPLPPARTDIGHYALRTMPSLAQHCDVVVWTERRYWPPELETYAEVRRWDGESWPLLNSADATLFHLGNNVKFHGWIWDVARRYPGIVVLHDTRLHEFFAGVLLDSIDGTGAYLDAVRRIHGDSAVHQAERMLRRELAAGELAESLPMTGLAVARARGAVVHTAAAFDAVSSLARCPVLQLDLPFAAAGEPAARSWDDPRRLIVFGYLGANRRLDALLDAIASFPEKARLELDIFGELGDAEGTTARIEALGLADRVRVRGFVGEGELDRALDQAHLAINLRYPTMGEASGSQLRIWSRGVASLVSRTGWYAELPADAVGFVDPASELADLHVHFRAALAEPQMLQAMGEAGRRYLVERHAPDVYARDLLAGLERMMRTPASIVGEVSAAVGRAIAGKLPERAAAAAARRAAAEVARWMSSG